MEKKYGLLGEKLGHSYSPQIHRAFGNTHYALYEKSPEEVAHFLQTGDFAGLNVTIPYKKTVIPFCRELSPAAQAIGSVNTLVRRSDGSLYGDNTDADGFRAMLTFSKVNPQGKKALVFGSGGASLTAVYVLKQLGATPVITISRKGPNNYENLAMHADAQILVNTTPVGMYPHTGEAPVQLKQFPQCEAVLDVIYNPARTQLLLDAEAAGIPHCDGLLMLVTQAQEAIKRWQPDMAFSVSNEEVTRQMRLQMNNVVLIGMPGCGKSTVGKQVAQSMQRNFVDSDAEIEKRLQMSIPTFFARYGEEAFRKEETAVLAELGKQSGLVIATGGGCVTRPENYPLLHQNGTILFLNRDIALLECSGRPLSLQTDLKEMYRNRLPWYEKFADAAIDNHTPPQETARKVQEVFYEITGH